MTQGEFILHTMHMWTDGRGFLKKREESPDTTGHGGG